MRVFPVSLIALAGFVGVVGCSGTTSQPSATPPKTAQAATPAGGKAPAPGAKKPAESKPKAAEPKANATAEAPDAWIEEAVEDALWREIMPGTDGEPDQSRRPALRAFFKANPQYKNTDERERLWAHACGMDGAEAAHAYLTNPPPKTPVEVQVDRPDWRVFATYTDAHCTSDDWAWYTAEANQAAAKHGAVIGYGSADNTVLVVKMGDKELARFELEDTGYVALAPGKEPLLLSYGPQELDDAFRDYFGPPPAPDNHKAEGK